MWLNIGGHEYRDGELSLAEVLKRLGEGVTTSGPAPGDLAHAVEEQDQGDGVVVLTVSQRMSAVYQSARLSAGILGGRHVEVVDTATAAGGQGLVVLAAARAAAGGADLGQVVQEARRAAAGTRLLATLPSLEYLSRSGRVPGAAAWGAKWLGLNPVFEFIEGKARPLRPMRGRDQARARMVALLEGTARLHPGRALHVAALHALEPGLAEDMLADVRSRLRPATAFAGPFSSVMVVHTGPGLAGLAWWWD